MATVTLTKQSVALQDGIYTITLHCAIDEAGIVIWEETGSGRYNPNSGNVDAPKAEILAALKEKWDKWVAEKNLHDSAALDVAVADLQSTITTYVNS